MDKLGLAALLPNTGYSTGDPVLDSIYGVAPLTEEELAAYMPPEEEGYTPVTPTEGVYGQSPRNTRGVRNNNPGNLNFAGQTGAVKEGGPNGRFAVFQSPEEGLHALAGQLRTYGGRGIDTVHGMISKWAPPTENNTRAYISRVASTLGVDPMQRLDVNDPVVMTGLMNSIIQMENGHNPYSQDQIAAAAGGAPQKQMRDYQTPSGQTISIPADVPDDEVASRMLEKHPELASQLGFAQDDGLQGFKTPSGKELRVPKDLSYEEAVARMWQKHPEQAQELQLPKPKGPETGPMAALTGGFKSGVAKGAEFAGELAHRAGYEDFAQKAGAVGEDWRKAAEQTYRPLTEAEIQQKGLLGKAQANVFEPLLHGVGEYGIPVGATMLGGELAAPVGVAGTVAVGGGTALEEAKAAGKTLSNLDLAWHTGVETLANYLRIPMGKLAPLASRLGDAEKREVITLLQAGNMDAAVAKAGSYLGQVGKAVLGASATGGAGSALSEANRIAIEGGDLTSPEAGQRVWEAGKAGAMVAAPLGVAHGHVAQRARVAEIEGLERGRQDLEQRLGRPQEERDLEQEIDEQGYTPEMRAQIEAARTAQQQQTGAPPPPPGDEGVAGTGEQTPPPPPPPPGGEGEVTPPPPKEQEAPPAPPKEAPPPPEPTDLAAMSDEDLEVNLTKLNEQSNAFMDANDYDNYDLSQAEIAKYETEIRKRAAENMAAGQKQEEPPAPPAAETGAPAAAPSPAPTPEITHFVERLKFKKPNTNLAQKLAKLDSNNPEDLKIALNLIAGYKDKDIPGVDALRLDLNRALANQEPISPLAGVPKKVAPTEAPSAQQIPETGAPDGGSGPQPILREKGGDQAVSGKGVEPSGQGEQAPKVGGEEDPFASTPEVAPTYEAILEHVLKSPQPHASDITRSFNVGLPEAQKLLLRMQNEGYISEPDDLGRREVLKKTVEPSKPVAPPEPAKKETAKAPEETAAPKEPETREELEEALKNAGQNAKLLKVADDVDGYNAVQEDIKRYTEKLRVLDETEAAKKEEAKAPETPAEPLADAVTQHVEATTVPRKRGRPAMSAAEKEAKAESDRVAKEAAKQAKEEAKARAEEEKRQAKAEAEGKKAKLTRKERYDATRATLTEQVKATKEKLDAMPKPDTSTFDPKDASTWSRSDTDWVKAVIDHVAAQRDFHQHRAHAKDLDEAEVAASAAEEAVLEKRLMGLTQAHRTAEHLLATRKATEAPKETAAPRATRAEAAEAWDTDRPEGHVEWKELSPTTQSYWQEAVGAGSHLHPELNTAIRNEIDALSRGEAVERERELAGRVARGLGLEAVGDKGELGVPYQAELADALTKGIKDKDLAKVAEALLTQQKNPIIRQVAAHVKKILTSGLKIAEVSSDDARLQGHGAFYDPATNTIHIASSHLADAPTVAHEMVHALTHYVLDHPVGNNQKRAVQQLKQLFDAVKNHELLKDQYGLKDLHEFVAEAFSNAEFQYRLAKIPYERQSAWGKFTQKIADLLGFKRSNALTELLSAAEPLFPSKTGVKLKTDAKKGLLYGPHDDDARLLSEARLTRTLPPDHKLMMQQAGETLGALRKSGGFGELFANLRYGLVSRDSKLAHALRNDPTFHDGKFRADLLLSQYGHLNQFASEGMRLGIPMRSSTGMMRIVADPEKNLVSIMERAHKLPRELGKGPDALANVLRALIGEHWMKEPERLRDRISYLKSDEKLVRDHAQTLSGDAKQNMLRTANKLRRELDRAQERLDKLPETGLEIKVRPEHIDAAKRLMEKYPELKKLADDTHSVMRGLVDLHEQVGLIDSFTARQWRKAPYIPLYMSMEDLAKQESKGRPYGPSAKNLRTVKQKGVSEHEVNVFENLQKHYFWMTQAAFQNNVRRGAMEQLSRWGMAERVSEVPTSKEAKERLVLTREHGDDVYHKVDDPYIVDVMSFPTQEALPEFLTVPSRAFSRLTLMNPGYWFKQIIRDPLVANFVSRTGIVTPFGAARSFLKIATGNSPEYDILRAHGVTGLVDAMNDSVRFSQATGKPGMSRRLWDKMKHIHEAADAATRVEVYKQALKQAKKEGYTGQTAEDIAVTKAREIINFSNQGASKTVGYFAKTVPFFSAGLNSLDVIARAALGTNLSPAEAKQARRIFRNRALVMTAASTAYAYQMAMNSQAYRDASDHDWTNAWLVQPPESWGWSPNRMIKIPSPFEIGFMFKFLPELAVRNMLGLTGTEKAKELAWETAKQTLPIQPLLNPIPTAFRGFAETAANYNFFGKYGIESPSMQGQMVQYRGAEKASMLANYLAQHSPERLQMSPVKWDHFLTASFSELYKTMTMLADLMVAPEGVMAAKDITQKAPLARVFVTNPNHYSGADDFYEMKQGAEQFRNTLVGARKTANEARMTELLGMPGGVDKFGASAAFNKQGEVIARLERMKQILTNAEMPKEEREKQLKSLDEQKKFLIQFYGNIGREIQERIDEAEEAAEDEE